MKKSSSPKKGSSLSSPKMNMKKSSSSPKKGSPSSRKKEDKDVSPPKKAGSPEKDASPSSLKSKASKRASSPKMKENPPAAPANKKRKLDNKAEGAAGGTSVDKFRGALDARVIDLLKQHNGRVGVLFSGGCESLLLLSTLVHGFRKLKGGGAAASSSGGGGESKFPAKLYAAHLYHKGAGDGDNKDLENVKLAQKYFGAEVDIEIIEYKDVFEEADWDKVGFFKQDRPCHRKQDRPCVYQQDRVFIKQDRPCHVPANKIVRAIGTAN